jgi:hypothetical protein
MTTLWNFIQEFRYWINPVDGGRRTIVFAAKEAWYYRKDELYGDMPVKLRILVYSCLSIAIWIAIWLAVKLTT